MTDPKQKEIGADEKLKDLNDPQDTAFELDGDDFSSPEAAARALEEHQASGETEKAVFGLDDGEEEDQGGAIPPELEGDEFDGETESPSFNIVVSEINEAVKSGSADHSETPLLLELDEAKQIIETLLFATHEPLRPRDISMVFRGVENVNVKVVRKLLAELMQEYSGRTLQIAEVAEGFRMCTRVEHSPWVRRFLKQERKWRVSNAGLETLAIIAYKQPITKMEVEEIRRVDCGGVLHTLLDRKMIRFLGRRDVVGKPIVYGTTPQFLEHFGFKNLTDMPKPDEFDMEIDLGEKGPGGDIIPIETEAVAEENGAPATEEPTVHHGIGSANGHANGSANGHANGSANGSVNDHGAEGKEEARSLAAGADMEAEGEVEN